MIETMVPATLAFYARVCGQTLALSYARSGDPCRDRRLPRQERQVRPLAITDFSERYADQNERDYLVSFTEAISAPADSKHSKASDDPVRPTAASCWRPGRRVGERGPIVHRQCRNNTKE